MSTLQTYDLGNLLQEATNAKTTAMSRVEALQYKCDNLREERELLYKMVVLRKRILTNLEEAPTTWGEGVDNARAEVDEIKEELKVVVNSMTGYANSLLKAENEYEICVIKLETIVQFMREQGDE